jgi:hypothetical protein
MESARIDCDEIGFNDAPEKFEDITFSMAAVFCGDSRSCELHSLKTAAT